MLDRVITKMPMTEKRKMTAPEPIKTLIRDRELTLAKVFLTDSTPRDFFSCGVDMRLVYHPSLQYYLDNVDLSRRLRCHVIANLCASALAKRISFS